MTRDLSPFIGTIRKERIDHPSQFSEALPRSGNDPRAIANEKNILEEKVPKSFCAFQIFRLYKGAVPFPQYQDDSDTRARWRRRSAQSLARAEVTVHYFLTLCPVVSCCKRRRASICRVAGTGWQDAFGNKLII